MMENSLLLELIIHPGETLKEVLENRNMNKEELANKTGYSLKYINEITSYKKDISLDFAHRLEDVLNISFEFWINLQEIYNKEILNLNKLMV